MATVPELPDDLEYDPYDYVIDANPHQIWARVEMVHTTTVRGPAHVPVEL